MRLVQLLLEFDDVARLLVTDCLRVGKTCWRHMTHITNPSQNEARILRTSMQTMGATPLSFLAPAPLVHHHRLV